MVRDSVGVRGFGKGEEEGESMESERRGESFEFWGRGRGKLGGERGRVEQFKVLGEGEKLRV